MTDKTAIEIHSGENRTFAPSAEFSAGARIKSREEYDALYRESLDSPETFYARKTSKLVFRKKWSALCE